MKTKLSKNEFLEGYKWLNKEARFNIGMAILSIFAVAVCVLGFKIDSPSIIIGSMLISPLLYPTLALSASLIEKDFKLLKTNILTVVVLLVALIGLSTFMSYLLDIDLAGSEITSRLEAHPFIYFLVALISGATGMFAFFWPGVPEAIPGVAISVALLPPISIVGFTLAAMDWQMFIVAGFVLALNIIGIMLGSIATLFILEKVSNLKTK